ncbi:Nitroreductase [Candidatus Desulfarcum epimagneticum]|uniref:Nitroreductase n=1 Tax=uncultured Desulfobacteraceae bacterium TaxID=218296 RepID=A0A484HE42_9BACT|nr:Nitroreductase [uncultured Desulfobacteraceae bacterium]
MTQMRQLVAQTRSVRRFLQDRKISMETLMELADLARLCPSAANLQPLRHVLSCDPGMNEKIFACLGWAAYLKDWPGPGEGERPAAYIVIMGDSKIANDYLAHDCGIAAQTILLAAAEKGLGGCMLGSVNRKKLAAILDAPDDHPILLVIALGEPGEKVRIEPLGPDGNIRYRRDENGVHHVPKRALEDVVLRSYP